MNKFKNLAGKLINNKLWCNNITYIKTEIQRSAPGLPISIKDYETINLNVVIKSVNKSLIDNINVFSTDKSIVIDALTVNPKKEDYIIIDGIKHEIIMIRPLGLMGNEATAYEIILRIA